MRFHSAEIGRESAAEDYVRAMDGGVYQRTPDGASLWRDRADQPDEFVLAGEPSGRSGESESGRRTFARGGDRPVVQHVGVCGAAFVCVRQWGADQRVWAGRDRDGLIGVEGFS